MHYGANEDLLDLRFVAEDWREIREDHADELESCFDAARVELPARWPRLALAHRQAAIELVLGTPEDELYRELARELFCDDPDELERYGENIEPCLIAEWHFEDYARELAEDLGSGVSNEWPATHIDWEAAAEALQQDYMRIEFGGNTYYIRA